MILSSLALGLVMAGPSRNLLNNGDFRHGKRGFVTYYGEATSLYGDGTYFIGTDPKLRHPKACSIHDHKTGHSNMMILNGSASPMLPFWEETVRVRAYQRYVFTVWATSWSMSPSDGSPSDVSPARVLLMVNGSQVGFPCSVSARSGEWKQFSFSWDSGAATSAKLRLIDNNTELNGNDFAVDDLQFTQALPAASNSLGLH